MALDPYGDTSYGRSEDHNIRRSEYWKIGILKHQTIERPEVRKYVLDRNYV